MEKLLLVAAAVIGLTASAAPAQTGGHEGMTSGQMDYTIKIRT